MSGRLNIGIVREIEPISSIRVACFLRDAQVDHFYADGLLAVEKTADYVRALQQISYT